MGNSTRMYEEMMKRIAKGEFGSEPNIADVVRVMSEEVNKPASFVNITGLWEGRGKVAYQGRAQEEIIIPIDAEILVFHNDKQNDTQPDLNLVYVD